jgi:hypothetical protein
MGAFYSEMFIRTSTCLSIKTLNQATGSLYGHLCLSVLESASIAQCYKTFLGVIYATSSVFLYDFD